MREDNLAIIVLAHGGWSAAWAWKKVRPLMAERDGVVDDGARSEWAVPAGVV
jgi:hypothetical protein